MNFEVQENDIVGRLSGLMPSGIEVIPMPENTKEFKRDFDEGRVTVAFNGASWDETQSTYQVRQEGKLRFAVIVQTRLLRGATGAYTVFNTIQKSLTGFSPTHCQQLTRKSFDLISDEDDLFTFFAEFECTCLYAEAFSEPDDLPLIKKITLDENLS